VDSSASIGPVCIFVYLGVFVYSKKAIKINQPFRSKIILGQAYNLSLHSRERAPQIVILVCTPAPVLDMDSKLPVFADPVKQAIKWKLVS
jgi:hypothetical protein